MRHLRSVGNISGVCSGLEKELAELIQSEQIQARIDSHNKVLYARHADQRNATFQSALRTGWLPKRAITSNATSWLPSSCFECMNRLHRGATAETCLPLHAMPCPAVRQHVPGCDVLLMSTAWYITAACCVLHMSDAQYSILLCIQCGIAQASPAAYHVPTVQCWQCASACHQKAVTVSSPGSILCSVGVACLIGPPC